MGQKKKLTENEFAVGPSGNSGAVSYGAGWGTYSSPDVNRSADHFSPTNRNKADSQKSLGSSSNTRQDTPAEEPDFDQEIDQIYSKKNTPSPDEVMTGLEYEMQKMIKKDKTMAKEIVLHNLKQDPHFYGKLHMLNIDPKTMMDVNPINKTSDPMQERINLLNQRLKARTSRYELSEELKNIFDDVKKKRNTRR